MSSTRKSRPPPVFDRSFLPDADFEFVVLGDTHYMFDPDAYVPQVNSAQFWSDRADQAIRLAAALEPAFSVHLGDLSQEFPGKPGFARARHEALMQFERHRLQPHHVAGNMDIGNKPDPTMPPEWVTPHSLAEYHRQFGRSWYSFDWNGVHCVVLNSEIMNGSLAEADEQRQWLESDLSEHTGQRIFIFMHMPPFFVDEHEPGTGSYNNIDEPARGWLLGLLREHKVELLFSAHTHFKAFNRIGGTRLFVIPSTTTSRAAFYEVFSVSPPPDQGRNDLAKLGFYLVCVRADGARVHFIRTNGQTGPALSKENTRRLITRTSQDLPDSPVGVYLRSPLAHVVSGAITWPDVVRLRVRDDHPFLACLELGVRHVRVPASDLEDDLQSQRLAMLRDEGVQVTAIWILHDRLRLAKTVHQYAGLIDAFEVGLPGTLWPDNAHLREMKQCRVNLGIPVTLAPLLPVESVEGKYFARTRIGYHALELPELNTRLSQDGFCVDRVVSYIEPSAPPWDAIQGFINLHPLSHIDNFDFVVPLPGTDENAQVNRAAEAVFAAALLPGCRLFLDPIIDLDRSNDIRYGLLDRLSNPRPAFHAARNLNTIIFGLLEEFRPLGRRDVEAGRVLGIEGPTRRLWLLLPDGTMSISSGALAGLKVNGSDILCFDLVEGSSQTFNPGGDNVRQILSGIERPTLLMSACVT